MRTLVGALYRAIFVIILLFSFSFSALALNIRVKVEEGQSIKIEPLTDAKVYDNNEELVMELKPDQAVTFKYYTSNKVSINGKNLSLPLHIMPQESVFNTDKNAIYIGSRKYRGMAVIASYKGKLLGINTLDMEDYLKGVVAGEMPQEWNMEALKSQAVAARTYAYYGMINQKNDLYDICDTVKCQVYKGIYGEYSTTNTAVDATKAKILTYNDSVIPAFFHDTSGGGLTESGVAFTGENTPYLQPVQDYDDNSPYRNWNRTLATSDFLDRLSLYGVKLTKISKVRVAYNESNRVKMVSISDGKRTYDISGHKFREIMGLKSNSFTISIHKSVVNINGSGNGHGIGLSQWGALGMAKMGYKYSDILSHYYPGTLLVSYE